MGNIENNSQKPLVSVIIPTWNSADTLGRSIKSVTNQTYTNIEVLVADDGSTDNTEEIIKNMTDKRIRYLKLPKYKGSEGSARAKNIGIKKSKGEYIAFQDSDDEWLPEKLEVQMGCFLSNDEGAGACFCAMKRITPKNEYIVPDKKYRRNDTDWGEAILEKNQIPMITILAEKSCLVEVGGFDERLRMHEDWDLMLSISKKYKIKYVNEVLAKAYAKSGSITTDPESKLTSLEIILKKHKSLFAENNKALGKHYSDLGRLYCALENYSFKEGRKYLYNSIQHRFFNFRTILTFLLSLLGEKFYLKLRGII